LGQTFNSAICTCCFHTNDAVLRKQNVGQKVTGQKVTTDIFRQIGKKVTGFVI